MKIVMTPKATEAARAAREAERARYKTGGSKVRIGWSQTRGGYAIFVSGRMEGPLHDTEAEAREYLDDLGVKDFG